MGMPKPGTVIELARTSALPLQLDQRGRLLFQSGLPTVESQIRRLEDMVPVLSDHPATGPAELYYMYRAVAFPEHRDLFAGAGIRYDVTVIRPGTAGGEYVKTMGHFHPLKPGHEIAYPEVYEVLHGRAHFLLQCPAPADAVVIEAERGERVLIPPGYGHVTINPGEEWLVLANLVADEFRADYSVYLQAGGAVYRELPGSSGPSGSPGPSGSVGLPGGRWEPNHRYGTVPTLRFMRPAQLAASGLLPGEPLYSAFLRDPARFDYLRNPQSCRYLGEVLPA